MLHHRLLVELLGQAGMRLHKVMEVVVQVLELSVLVRMEAYVLLDDPFVAEP